MAEKEILSPEEKERIRKEKWNLYMKKYRARLRKKNAEKNRKRREREKLRRQREREKKLEREKEKKRKKRERERLKKLNAPKKRKVGRPKKIGRKKKWKRPKVKKQRVYTKLPPFSYRIVSCTNYKQRKIIGKYRDRNKAYEAFENLRNNQPKIVFPKTFYAGDEMAKNYINEYVLLTTNETERAVYFRDEYGRVRNVESSSENWRIIDKFKYDVEEDFWVFGMDKVSERKTFDWIYENLLLSNIETMYDFKRVMVYKNKLVIKDDNGHIDLIICKCDGYAVKMYNMMSERARKAKIKQIIFAGDYSAMSEKRLWLEKELLELTGWTLKKLRMKNQTFYMSHE
jgi:hypothetical protein